MIIRTNHLSIGLLLIIVLFILFFTSELTQASALFDYLESIGPKGTPAANADADYYCLFRMRVYPFVFGTAIAFALIGYYVAKRKEENPFVWTLICFFTNIFGLLFLILKKRKL